MHLCYLKRRNWELVIRDWVLAQLTLAIAVCLPESMQLDFILIPNPQLPITFFQ
jgi:hypothetical protein